MNTRRSFFAKCAGMIATIALAPELAFRAKLAFPEVKHVWEINWTTIQRTPKQQRQWINKSFWNEPLPPDFYEHT